MKYIFYGHNGSANHGCEAIVRTALNVTNNENHENLLLSYNPERDYPYGVDNLVDKLSGYYIYSKVSPWRFYTNFWEKLFKKKDTRYKVFLKDIRNEFSEGDIAFSIGGDNYCYPSFPQTLASYNRIFHEYGLKTVLFGCSIEPEVLEDQEIVEDMKKYNLIIARESLSLKALNDHGIIDNVKYAPDTAFVLEKESVTWPSHFKTGNIVGINLSPRVGLSGPNHDIIFQAYEKMMRFILDNTDMNIALIPHVVVDGTDDRTPLKLLQNKFGDNKRIYMVPDGNCQKLKGYIADCRFMVAARTHASIAAYSSAVPTLVMGYSIKSKGIALDLFGTTDNYVISDTDIASEDDMVRNFKWLLQNENMIRNHLRDFIPQYIERILLIPEWIKAVEKSNES